MWIKKTIILFCILTISFGFISGEEYIDYGNPEDWSEDVYESKELYENFEQIPPEKYDQIAWEDFDFSREEFDFHHITWDLDSLPSEFHISLASSEVGLRKYITTFGDERQIIDIEVEGQERIFFDGKGMGTDREHYIRLEDYPSNTLFRAMPDGTIRVSLRQQQIRGEWTGVDLDLSDAQRFDQNTQAVFFFGEDMGHTIRTLDGRDVPVEGELIYFGNEFSLAPNKQAKVNNVRISNSDSFHQATIYGIGTGSSSRDYLNLETENGHRDIYNSLMGEKLEVTKSALFLGRDSFVAARDCEYCTSYEFLTPNMNLGFEKDNPYIDIYEKGDNRILGFIGEGQIYDDLLEIDPLDGGFIWADQRGSSIGSIEMQNGHRELGIIDGNIFSSILVQELESDSVSMEIELFDKEFNNPYEGVLNDQGEELSNTLKIKNDHKIDFGKTSHFSIAVDPQRVLGMEEGTLEVLNNIKGSNVKEPFIIIGTPGDTELEERHIRAAVEIQAKNLPREYYPVPLYLDHPHVVDENYAELRSDEHFNRVGTYERLLQELSESPEHSSFGYSEEEKYDFLVVGHSSLSHDPVRGHQVTMTYAGTRERLTLEDRTQDKRIVEFANPEDQDRILGCSIAEQEMNRLRSEYLTPRVEETEEYSLVTLEEWMEIGQREDMVEVFRRCGTSPLEINPDCVIRETEYDIFYSERTNLYYPSTEVRRSMNDYVIERARDPEISSFYQFAVRHGHPSPSIKAELAPLFSAIDALQTSREEYRNRPMRDLLVGIEEHITFPDCEIRDYALEVIKEGYPGLDLQYRC